MKMTKVKNVVNIGYGIGANATVMAMAKRPECFKTCKVLFMVNPRNGSV
jgi:hypothetical protein